jgi:hypothetical protein
VQSKVFRRRSHIIIKINRDKPQVFENNGVKPIENKMKQKKSHIDVNKELEATYALLGKEERLESNPFLFTRIEQQIENRESSGSQSSFYRVLQPIFMSVLLLVAVWGGIKIGNSYTLEAQMSDTEYFMSDMEHESFEIALLNE